MFSDGNSIRGDGGRTLGERHIDDEAWYVLDGMLRFRIGEETSQAGPGSAVLAPKGTPAAIIDKLYKAVQDALRSDEVKAYMATAGIELVGSSPAEFGPFFRAERDLWGRLVRETGATLD